MPRTFIFVLSLIFFTSLFAQQEADKSFESFFDDFINSAEFQYSRIKFPMVTPIYLLDEEGNEIEVPFTADEWPLLGKSDFPLGTVETEFGIVFGQYTTKNAEKVVFESGLEESELDLLITFEITDGKWFVTDCYNAWYGNLRVYDFDSTIYEVQQLNLEFIEQHP